MKKLLSATVLGACIVTFTSLLFTSLVKAMEIRKSSSQVFNQLPNAGSTSSKQYTAKALLNGHQIELTQKSSWEKKEDSTPAPRPSDPPNPKVPPLKLLCF